MGDPVGTILFDRYIFLFIPACRFHTSRVSGTIRHRFIHQTSPPWLHACVNVIDLAPSSLHQPLSPLFDTFLIRALLPFSSRHAGPAWTERCESTQSSPTPTSSSSMHGLRMKAACASSLSSCQQICSSRLPLGASILTHLPACLDPSSVIMSPSPLTLLHLLAAL